MAIAWTKAQEYGAAFTGVSTRMRSHVRGLHEATPSGLRIWRPLEYSKVLDLSNLHRLGAELDLHICSSAQAATGVRGCVASRQMIILVTSNTQPLFIPVYENSPFLQCTCLPTTFKCLSRAMHLYDVLIATDD